MTRIGALLASLARDSNGSTVVETAIIVPPLLVLSIGSFDVSRMMARQSELQKAINEASDIALAAKPDTDTKKATVRTIVMSSSGLGANNVTLSTIYRCGKEENYVTSASVCDSGKPVYTFIRITLIDTYKPMWTNFGVGKSYNYKVRRQVQIS